MKKIIKMYLNGCKETNYWKGEKEGLTGEALDSFRGALYEVEFDVELDMETGDTEILKVDRKNLLDEWKNAQEEQPKDDTRKLCLIEDAVCVHFFARYNVIQNLWVNELGTPFPKDSILYWMDLPSLPKDFK